MNMCPEQRNSMTICRSLLTDYLCDWRKTMHVGQCRCMMCFWKHLIWSMFVLLLQQIPQLNLSSDVEIVSGLSFPLGPPTSTEPPKEKPPPPPPAEISDDELTPVSYVYICMYCKYSFMSFSRKNMLVSWNMWTSALHVHVHCTTVCTHTFNMCWVFRPYFFHPTW